METLTLALLALMTTVAAGEFADDTRYQDNSVKSNLRPLCLLTKKPLRIGAFNIQILGATKFNKNDIVDILIRIIKRYDVILIQEIRDVSKTVIHELVDLVNLELECTERYNMVLSERLGRSTSKEQYAFMYKPSKIEVMDEYVYGDSYDVFEREPYVVWLRSKVTSLADFAIVGIHVKPTDAVNEINNLTKVYDDLQQRHAIKDVIFAGDFNADCSYVSKNEWRYVTLRLDNRFVWLIDDDVDTTVSSTDCAYDRFVIAGERMAQAYVPESASVFHFDKVYHLDSTTAADVSDHYPIEMNLMPRSKPSEYSSGSNTNSEKRFLETKSLWKDQTEDQR